MVLRKLNLNLASNPLRNRRFFYLLLSVLIAAVLLVSFFAGKTFLEYRNEANKLNTSILKTDQMTENVQRDEKNYSTRIETAALKYEPKVDLINSIILRKSFSWIQFFSDLESSLPDSGYIVSMEPVLAEHSRLQLRLKIATSSVNDLLELIDNLKELKFDQIRMKSENLSENGMLVSEISLSYERNI